MTRQRMIESLWNRLQQSGYAVDHGYMPASALEAFYIESRILYPYWWAPAFLIDARKHSID